MPLSTGLHYDHKFAEFAVINRRTCHYSCSHCQAATKILSSSNALDQNHHNITFEPNVSKPLENIIAWIYTSWAFRSHCCASLCKTERHQNTLFAFLLPLPLSLPLPDDSKPVEMHYPEFGCQVSKQLLKTWCLYRMIMCKHAHSFTWSVSFMATKQKSHIISPSFYVWIWKFETQIHVYVCVSQQLCMVSMFNLFSFFTLCYHERNRMHKHLFLRLLLANYLKTGQNRTLLIICNPVITACEKKFPNCYQIPKFNAFGFFFAETEIQHFSQPNNTK